MQKIQTRRTTAVLTSLFIATSACAAGPSGSTSAWRCGNSYSDQPCAGGRTVTVDDARSSAEAQAQSARTRDTQRQADAMARERQALEAQAAGQRPALITRPTATPAPLPPQARATQPKTHKASRHPKGASDAFTARDASAEAGDTTKKKTKKKAKA